MKRILSIDIGSTWTKGALFESDGEFGLKLLDSCCLPTTVDDLAHGFAECRQRLDRKFAAEVHYSSSAKGGLRIAALGVVPELTLKVAHQAACSAGGKITGVFAYKLCDEDIGGILDNRPDLILFTGGTDGGNEEYVRHNLLKLKQLPSTLPIIYAGNRVLADEVRKNLADRPLRIVANVLPELERPNVEPARHAIRELFLELIAAGRGLDKIVASTGRQPMPTPYSIYEFLKMYYNFMDKKIDFAVIDLGGATTDFYSACLDNDDPGVVRRGLPEPEVKRTVEGDLGMRVSAASAAMACGMEATPYLDKINSDYNYLPQNKIECEADANLASCCCSQALERHAGRRRQVYTANGLVAVQTGRNLRSVSLIVGSGGYLSGLESEQIKALLVPAVPEPECEVLEPLDFICRPDRGSMLVMAANAACSDSLAACKFWHDQLNLEI